ncbi:MAG: cytochrome b/b6 domain-containing protein [Cyanobacteria bacterium J06649_5]
MSRQPYQPLFLRILHGLTGICLILALATAFWTYNVFDGRWGTLPLPEYKAIEGIHGTFGLYTLLIFPVFVWYAFSRGRRRLMQSDSVATLAAKGQVSEPIWWYTLNRLTNTLALVALTFALFSGKMMDSTWLHKGELHHFWYSAHLIGWVVMVLAIALHLLINARVGGVPLLRSMWTRSFRFKDSPRFWRSHVLTWWAVIKQRSWPEQLQAVVTRSRLELAIEISLIAAWAISLAKEATMFLKEGF